MYPHLRQLGPWRLLYSLSFILKWGLYLYLQLSAKCYHNSIWERTCQRTLAAEGEGSLCPFVPDAIKNSLSPCHPRSPPLLDSLLLFISQECLVTSLAAPHRVTPLTLVVPVSRVVLKSLKETGMFIFQLALRGGGNNTVEIPPVKNRYVLDCNCFMLIDDADQSNTPKPYSNSTDVPNWCLSH